MLEWLAHTPYAEWVNVSWGWALALTIHAFGTATVIGLMFIIGLRLLGLFRTIPYTSLNKLLPLVWIAIACQIVSGFTLVGIQIGAHHKRLTSLGRMIDYFVPILPEIVRHVVAAGC